MKILLTTFLAICTTGCGAFSSEFSNAEKACSAYIVERLKAPSTFKMSKASHSIDLLSTQQYLAVSSEGTMGKLGKDVVDRYPKPGMHTVVVTYDAENSFGAPIRSLGMCRFLMEDAENGKYSRDDLESEAKSRATMEQLQATTAALTGTEARDGGCCLREGADESSITNLKNLKVKIEGPDA